MTLLAREFVPRLAQELARQQRDAQPLSLALLAAPVTELALAALRGSLRSVDVVTAPDQKLIAVLLPATDAPGARIVADRMGELLTAATAVTTFPPYDVPPLDDAAYADFSAGGTAWCSGPLPAALAAVRGYAARFSVALAVMPRPQRYEATVGPRELRAYLEYEIRRSRRYGLSFAVGFCGSALAGQFDRALRAVVADTALGDVFGILEGGCLFVFSYHTAPAETRLLDSALRRHFQLAADNPAVRVLGFPADANTPEDFLALLDPVTGSLR